jgi:hypothetical protein
MCVIKCEINIIDRFLVWQIAHQKASPVDGVDLRPARRLELALQSIFFDLTTKMFGRRSVLNGNNTTGCIKNIFLMAII